MAAEMDDVRCPMCGRPNPADFEVCQYCQARLKPLYISSEEEKDRETPGETPEATGGVTDWLRSLVREDESSEQQGAPEDDRLDWLKELKDEKEVELEASFEQPEPSLSEPPAQDWLEQLRAEGGHLDEDRKISDTFKEGAQSPSKEGETLPEWLAELRSSATKGPSEATFDQEYGEESIGEPSLIETSSQETQTPIHSDEESVPDWYLDIEERVEEEPLIKSPGEETKETPFFAEQPGSEKVGEGKAKGEEAEWFLEEGGFPEGKEEPEQPSLIEEKRIEESAPQQITEEIGLAYEPQPPGAASEEVTPVSEALAPEVEEAEEEVEQAAPPKLRDEAEIGKVGLSELELPDWLMDTGVSDEGLEVPDWLLTTPEPLTLAEEEQPVEEGKGGLEVEQLETFSEEPGEIEAQPSSAWEKGIGEVEDSGGLPLPEELQAAGEQLEQAEIPAWLKPMQPIESVTRSVAIEEDEGRVEPAGPLAGLRGVLPAEPDVAVPRKPSAYSLRLQVSERQQEHALLLKKLVEEEGEVKPLPQEALISPQHIFRIVIAIVLFASTLFPLVMGFPQMERPSISASALAVGQVVNRLERGAPVLVVVDYQAGYVGELDRVVSTVMDHLMIKGAFIALVSTSPLGALQAERLIAVTNRNYQHDYRLESQYVNLGYIPGGTAGLRSFAEQPRLTLPLSIYGTKVWTSGSLESVNQLSDFHAILVATESFESARAWIEQTQEIRGDTPILFVVSAQTRPVLLPYAQQPLPQITGLLSGMMDAVSYEQTTGRGRIFPHTWTSFSLGGLVMVVLILIGVGANLISAILRPHSMTKRVGSSAR